MQHPPGAGCRAWLLGNQEGSEYRMIRLRKAFGEMFPTPSFLVPTLFQLLCGNIELGNSAQGGLVLYAPSSYKAPQELFNVSEPEKKKVLPLP